MKLRLFVAASIVGAVSLVLSSCSSSGGDSPSGKSSAAGTGSGSTSQAGVQQASGQPITLGTILPVGAPFYNTPDNLAAIRAAIASINKGGGVKGRPLKLDWCNEGNDANKGRACARQMIDDHVIATVGDLVLFDPVGADGALAKAGVAQVTPLETSTPDFESPLMFPIDTPGVWTVTTAACWAVQNAGLKKIAIIRSDSPTGVVYESLVGQGIKNAGGTVAKTVLIPQQQIADWSPYAQQVIDSDADAVVVPLPTNQALAFVKALRSLSGSKIKVIVSTGEFSNKDLKDNAKQLDGTYIGLGNPWTHDGGDYSVFAKFKADMDAAKAAGDADADLSTARQFTFGMWASVYAIKQVLEGMIAQGTALTTANFVQALKSATIDRGLGFQWKPGQYQTKVPAFKNLATTMNFVGQARDGEWVLVQKQPIDTLKYLAP